MSASTQNSSYTVTVFTENLPGLLTEVVSVFTRIKLNIDTLTTSASTIEGIHRFTVTVKCSEKIVNKIVGQLEKKIDVVAAFAYLSDEIVAREIAIFKVNPQLMKDAEVFEKMMEIYNPAVIEEHDDYAVLIKTGKEANIQAMYEFLKPSGFVFEFVRSGRIAIVRAMDPFCKRLDSMDQEFH